MGAMIVGTVRTCTCTSTRARVCVCVCESEDNWRNVRMSLQVLKE